MESQKIWYQRSEDVDEEEEQIKAKHRVDKYFRLFDLFFIVVKALRSSEKN